MKNKLFLLLLFSLVLGCMAKDKSKYLTLHLERIDPLTNKVQTETEQVACNKTAIVIIDMWDKHWCKTQSARDAALLPGMNKVLDAARKMGVQVIFSPSNCSDFYRNDPQRQAVLATAKSADEECPSVETLIDREGSKTALDKKHQKKYFEGTIYEARDFPGVTYKGYPALPPFAHTGGCECKERTCKESVVWQRQNKDLIIAANDLIVEGDSVRELFDVCKARGLTHLLYMGAAGNMCISWTRETSAINMLNRGLKCALMEDLVISITGNGYNPDTKKEDPSFTYLKGDSLVLDHLKKYVAPAAKSYQVFAVAR